MPTPPNTTVRPSPETSYEAPTRGWNAFLYIGRSELPVVRKFSSPPRELIGDTVREPLGSDCWMTRLPASRRSESASGCGVTYELLIMFVSPSHRSPRFSVRRLVTFQSSCAYTPNWVLCVPM